MSYFSRKNMKNIKFTNLRFFVLCLLTKYLFIYFCKGSVIRGEGNFYLKIWLGSLVQGNNFDTRDSKPKPALLHSTFFFLFFRSLGLAGG